MLNFWLYKAIWPMLAVLGSSFLTLLLVLWTVSLVEVQRGRLGVFELEIRAIGDAPLWVLLMAGMLVTNGISMGRWAVATANVDQRRAGRGYEVNVPFPIGKMAAVNMCYIGAAVIVFFLLRTHW